MERPPEWVQVEDMATWDGKYVYFMSPRLFLDVVLSECHQCCSRVQLNVSSMWHQMGKVHVGRHTEAYLDIPLQWLRWRMLECGEKVSSPHALPCLDTYHPPCYQAVLALGFGLNCPH